MEKKRIPVRPHHGMCLAYFIGKGYSEGFSAHMEKMLHILEQDVSIRLVVSLDEICSACPNRQVTVEASGVEKEICEAQEKVYRYDHGVLDACGLAEGEELNFLEFTRKVQDWKLSQAAHRLVRWRWSLSAGLPRPDRGRSG